MSPARKMCSASVSARLPARDSRSKLDPRNVRRVLKQIAEADPKLFTRIACEVIAQNA